MGSSSDPDGGSTTIFQRFAVELSYPVAFTRGAFSPSNAALRDAIVRLEPARRHRCLAVLDSGVARARPDTKQELAGYARAYDEQLELVDAPIVIAGGEQAKNDPRIVEDLQARFAVHRLDRHAVVLVVGGGAVLDAVGYAASVTHRGLRVVRMPSTVLAQNDAGIGVKNGVNAFGAKNFFGTFAAPFAVVNDVELIESLEARDKRSGIAEAVKVGLIRDLDFFLGLESRATSLACFERDTMAWMIRRCAELHLRHISTSGDPFELGSARPLDFGHWAAHKLEVLSRHELRHGEAVAIGIALDTWYSALAGSLPFRDAERVCQLLQTLGLPRWHPALDQMGERGRRTILDGLDDFREHLGGELTVTLLEALGRSIEVHHMDPEGIEAAVAKLREGAGS